MARLREGVLSLELAHVMRERFSLRAALDTEQRLGQSGELAIAQRHSANDELRRELRWRREIVAAIKSSASWRLTAPLRMLTTFSRNPSVSGIEQPAVPVIASVPAAQPLPLPEPHPSPDSRQRTILVVADFPPLYDQSAGGLRLRTLIQIMGGAGWHIRFGSFYARQDLPGVLRTEPGLASYEAALREDGVAEFLYGLPEIARRLEQTGAEIDWAFLSFPTVAVELLPVVRCLCPHARVAYDMVDFHSLRMERAAAVRGDAELAQVAVQQRALELSCVHASDVTIAVTSDERDAVRSFAPKASIEILPCIFDLPPSPAPLEGRKDLLFVGGFWHEPNSDAMIWFVEAVWPLVRMNEPEAVLRIVGANAGEDVLALAQTPGVEILGFVSDLTEVFDRHRVFVAPLRFGAGMKGKVAQSLSFGLPVVGTNVAAEGMGLVAGQTILVADEPTLFADHIVRLIRDDYLWANMAQSGRAHIEANFSVRVVREQLLALLDG